MKDKAALNKILDFLDVQYRSAQEPEEALLFAKIAFLEFCGWIEECMDLIALECCDKLLESEGQESIKQIVKSNHSFTYKDHFSPIIARVVGLCNLQHIEKNIDLIYLKSMTGSLKSKRDDLAHKPVDIQLTIDAPSKIKTDFNRMFDELEKFEKELKKQMKI